MENKPSIWTFFIERRPVAWLLAIGIIIMGVFSAQTLPKEIQPEINIQIGAVTTALPGANPADVESLITEPLEKEIATVDNIKTLTSTSALGLSSIVIEFEAEADLDESIKKVKDKVDIAKTSLPQDATEPAVAKAEANSQAVITFSVIGGNPSEISQIAEALQDELEAISGVSKVSIFGNQEKQIDVKIDPEKINKYGLNINQVNQLIKGANYNLPIGVISTDKINYSVRIDNRIQSIEELRNIPLFKTTDENQTSILLKDIATVEQNFNQQSQISKVSFKGEKSEKAISLQVFKKDGDNVIAVVDEAKELTENFETPEGIEIVASNDNSEYIRTDLGILTNSGIQTTILIIIILFLALGLVEGVLAALSIPLTLLATMIILKIVGMTINSLSLFSLVIALGLMVDTAIVIMEGIYENLKNGLSAKESAIKSVETYQWPLIAGTFTTVFAFFPMLLVSGILGDFLKVLPITISAALISSIFLSLTIIPSVSVKFLSKRAGKEHKTILAPVFEKIGNSFSHFIGKLLSKKSYRVITILVAIFLFLASMSLPITGALKVEMFPQTDVRFFIVNIETPKGLVLEETEKITENIEEQLYKIPEIESFLTIVGTGQSQAATDIVSFQGAGSSNLANITISLVPAEEREKKSYVVADEIRTELEKIKDIEVTVQEFSEGPPSDSPIALSVSGNRLDVLEKISDDIQEIIRSTNGTENIDDNLSTGLSEFKFKLDREKLNYHGLSGIEVSSIIRNIVQGVEATELKVGEDDLTIRVKYDFESPNNTPDLSVKTIENYQISTPKGYPVSLGEIGKFELVEGLSSIAHEDQDRIVKIKSDVGPNENVVNITAEIEEKIANYDLPAGYKITFGGDTEDIEKSFQELFQSMFVAVILIGFTLVLMFNSLTQPFIILMTLPLALIGVFPGLMSIGLALSFPAFLGVVALSGVVVNDAIVLIDRINKNREKGTTLVAAVTEATNARLQPIIMTTVTTVVGILPLALTNEFWAGLGFSLIFGLITATSLTLVVIPIIYYMFESRKEKKEIGKFSIHQ